MNFRPVVLIPNHNHKETIEALLERLAPYEIDCLIVDDGSEPQTQLVLEAAASKRAWVQLLRRQQRGGKGAAVMDGLRRLEAAGFVQRHLGLFEQTAIFQHCADLPGDGMIDFVIFW